MIEISTISARKLPIPHGCEFHFIVTASIGDSSVSSAPVKPVVDHRLGSSVTFREPLVLPCYVDGSMVDIRAFGVTLHFRSVCSTMTLGTAVCRVSKQWVPVIPTGEAMISFSISEPLAAIQPHGSGVDLASKRPRPSTAGPAVRDDNSRRPTSGQDESAMVTTSEYSGTLTVNLKSIAGLAISTSTPVSLYVQAQFALDEVQSSPIEVIPESDGHRGAWPVGSSVSFEVLPSNTSRIMTLSVFGAWVKSGSGASLTAARGSGTGPHHLIGVCKVDVPTNLGGENQRLSTTLAVSGHPRSRFEVDVLLTYLKPRKEGAGGRPLSAYPRRTPGASSSGDFSGLAKHGHSAVCAPPAPLHDDDDDVMIDTVPAHPQLNTTAASHRANGNTNAAAASKLRSKVGAGRKAWGDDNGDAAASFHAVLLAKLEDSIVSAVNAATSSVMERLGALESRVQRTEEMMSQLRPPTASQRPGSGYGGGPRIPKAPSSLSGAASRPSSADSVGGAYDVSHSIVTDAQLRTKFQEYDIKHRGFISVAQLIHFYRANNTFGDDEDEARILKYFDYCGIRVRSTDGISFDDFARLALKLAQR